MPPPPPPGPPPPLGPPPAPSLGPPAMFKSEQKGRNALLNDICKKPKLKSASHLTVDKSAPMIEGLFQ